MKGGNPDRFANQYEFMELIVEVPMSGKSAIRGSEVKDAWGVTKRWSKGQPAAFLVHDNEHTVLKDITKWKKILKMPSVDRSVEEWVDAVEHANSVDRDKEYVVAMFATGIFERLHFLMGMKNALMAFYEEPEAMHELIDFITEYEIE